MNEKVEYIKDVIKQPVEYINDITEEIYWFDDWGNESEELLKNEVRKRLVTAPKSISSLEKKVRIQ